MTRTAAVAVVLLVAGAITTGLLAIAQAASPAVEGAVFSGEVVAAPQGCNPDPASGPAPTIDWGDGSTPTAGTCTSSDQGVNTGPHTYAEEGSYSAHAHYTSFNSGAQSTAFSVPVADAALSATSGAVAGTAGTPVSGVVAHFNDADPNRAATDFTATITWGDGSSTSGTVQASGAGFDVSGSHTYGSSGSYSLTVAINDAGGATVNASGSAAIGARSTPAGSAPAQASFTLPSSAGAGGR